MKNQRLKQISLSLCVVLSLLISSITACACAHHQENSVAETSCHEHSEMPMRMVMPGDLNQAATTQTTVSGSSDCNCVKPAPKAYSKSQFLKLEKQTAEITPVVSFQAAAVSLFASDVSANFAQPFQLSDSSYNIKSPRAPPRL